MLALAVIGGQLPVVAAPVVIFKMDDVREVSTTSGLSANWERLFDYVAAKPLVISAGIIGESLETTHPNYASSISQIHATGRVEFWNHGLLHVRDQPPGTHEFSGTGYAYQLNNFETTQRLAREKLGFPFTTFGAPYNQTDADTLLVLATDPDMQTTMFVPSTPPNILNLERWLNIESATGVVRAYEDFVAAYQQQQHRPYLVLQGHPNNWNTASFETFELIVDYLISEGATFMTPSGYRASLDTDGDGVVVTHNSMDQRPGYPAIIAPGGEFPRLTVAWPNTATVEASLVRTATESVLQTLAPQTLVPGSAAAVTFAGDLPEEGVYRIDLRIHEGGSPVYRRAFYFSVLDTAALPANHSQVAHPGPDGLMRYIPDLHGNRLPDFSGVGYRGGADLPEIPTAVTVVPGSGDDTQRIQDAIDQVSALSPDSAGFRGAVELAAGLYEIGGTLRIEQSGVVLRGAGPGNIEDFMLNPSQDLSLTQWLDAMAGTTATVLVATGPDHRTLLTIAGSSGLAEESATATEILDEYVPVGRRWFHVADPQNFAVGDTILLERRGNADWISYMKMDQIPDPDNDVVQWSPFDLQFEFIITAIDGNRITVDSGLVSAVEQRWGGGRILRYSEGGRIRQSGVEDLRAVSFWQINADGKDDTAHADRFVVFDRVRDSWARNVAAEHFTPNTVGMFYTGRESLGITIEDCSALAAATAFYSGTGYDSSGRYYLATGTYVGRYGFLFTGQNGLVRNCYTINNRHAFTVGSRVTGPNVFSDSTGVQGLTYSEPHHRWSVGGLYDNVSDKEFSIMNRLNYGTGHGWAGANYVAWNTTGSMISQQPPTAQNWAIGHTGSKVNGPFYSWNMTNYGLSHGYWESQNQRVEPVSLYTQQLADRQARSGIRLFNDSPATTQVLPGMTLELEVFAAIGEDLPAGEVTYEWRVLSGPGNAVFTHPSQRQSSVVLDALGDYEVELIARCPSPEVEERIAFTVSLQTAPPEVESTGGSTQMLVTPTQTYRIHTFAEVGTHTFEVQAGSGGIDLLVVAGGGGGGGSDKNRWGGAGGGGGGVIATSLAVAPGTYSVQVGDGGLGGVGAAGSALPGENSVFGDLVALGGGRGRGQNSPGDGGSGSGGAPISSAGFNNSGGLGLQPGSSSGGFGNHGGAGTTVLNDDRAGGGGGGAGAPGTAATGGRGGNGGNGYASDISGSLSYYGGGGGGAGRTSVGSGGSGGGGNGGLNTNGAPGLPNTGGGGGASSRGDPHLGGQGGSGIVIVRVPVPSQQSALTSSETRIALNWPQATNSPQMRWTPQANASYVLQTSEDLVTWHNSGQVLQADINGTEILHTLPERTADRQFFRLVEIE